MDPNPTVRTTFWSAFINGAFIAFSAMGVGQTTVQRYCALPTLGKARWCVCMFKQFLNFKQKSCKSLTNYYAVMNNNFLESFTLKVAGDQCDSAGNYLDFGHCVRLGNLCLL